ncbi:MAG: glyoxalase-like domain protein [Cyanobacteriota bacterium]|nr:glyoxalase-like domain protein [Cyanobacteriota bacterium]
MSSLLIGAFLPLDSLFSTQGIMVVLLGAYALAMWMFLTSAPKVYTIMVTDLDYARRFYEGLLELAVADVPLHYYYNYEQTLGTTGMDSFYLASQNPVLAPNRYSQQEGLWYQLKKNTQLHIIGGASYGDKNRQRHVCFDHDCLELIFLRVQSRRLRHKLRSRKPLQFLVKDYDEQVLELVEIKN